MANPSVQLPPLIPRDLLFGNPERRSPALSPDGLRLAWLAPDSKNVLQVWVQTVGKEDSKIVTADKKRGIRWFTWAKDNRTLLYQQDREGDENFHLYGVDLPSGNVRDFTPLEGVRADFSDFSHDFLDTILITMNARNRALFDVYRLNLPNGALDLDTENPGDVSNWIADTRLQVRLAQIATPDGGTELRTRDKEQSSWKTWIKVGPQEILDPLGFAPGDNSVYLLSSLGRDTAAVIEKHLATGEEKLLAASDQVDAGSVVIHPTRHVMQAVAFSPARTAWQVVDPTVKDDFAALAKIVDADFSIVNRTEADDVWLVAYVSDRAPARYYRWNRKARQSTFLFASRPQLDQLPLAEMKPIVITTRDGLQMHAYLTLPGGLPPKNLPLVLFPHGGPFARNHWLFDPYPQWLANRGYAVLQPNFRASTGYGKKFLNAGDKQWGGKMHEDLIDAVNWAVKEGIADPKRLGILGGSYGGYCALAALTFTPEVFACAVDIVGPSNLRTLAETIPPYWKPWRSVLDVRMGNIDDPADAELLYRASPLNFADKIVRPLLIGQGANDPRVKQSESEQIVAAIEKNHGSVTYVLYPDEGHGFARPENSTDFTARAEAFLGEHLGCRFERMNGDKIPGSTAVVRIIGTAS